MVEDKRPPKRGALGENQPGQERIDQARRAWYATRRRFLNYARLTHASRTECVNKIPAISGHFTRCGGEPQRTLPLNTTVAHRSGRFAVGTGGLAL